MPSNWKPDYGKGARRKRYSLPKKTSYHESQSRHALEVFKQEILEDGINFMPGHHQAGALLSKRKEQLDGRMVYLDGKKKFALRSKRMICSTAEYGIMLYQTGYLLQNPADKS